MGKIFKFGCLGIIALIVLGIIIAALGGGGESEKTSKETSTQEQSKSDNKAKEESGNKEGISKAEFDQIQNGMTYEEVKGIIGSEGEVLSETGSAGDQFHTIMYKWDGEKGFGANANFTFQEDKLQNKSQFGLK